VSNSRISFRTTSPEQHDELVAYALVKGHKDVSAYALYAAVTMMSKNPLTESQRAQADKIIGEAKKTR
jgi:hypothetical protein